MYQYNNHIFLFVCIGGIFLAAVYHSILFLHRRESLLNYYSQYLWILLFYLGFRVDLHFNLTGLDFYHSAYHWDEIFQMLSFMFYVHFFGQAIFLKKADHTYAWYFYKVNVPVVLIYCVLLLVLTNFPFAVNVLKVLIRAYLLSFGLLFIIILWSKRRSSYYKYLFAAAASMILFGLLSTLSMIIGFRLFGFGPFHWLLISFYADVIFFSAALGYLIRQEYQQRESSLKQLLKSEAELQQKELEKMKVVYETREEERMRIARDIHDDMGSTLSSISIYSKVVATYLTADRDKANAYLEKIQVNAGMLMENTTDLIWSLQTNYGESESIFRRMYDTGIQLLSSAGIVPHFSIPLQNGLPRLTIPAQKNCWLIFKEALNNICKYSKAVNCTVEMYTDSSSFIMKIADDGIGFTAPNAGNGLVNMRKRAGELGGECRIESHAGKGTVVTVHFPLQNIVLPGGDL